MAKQEYRDVSDEAKKAAMANLLKGVERLSSFQELNRAPNNNKEQSLNYSIE